MDRANILEATRARIRRRRELDQLVRASCSQANSDRVKEPSHKSHAIQQNSGQQNSFAGKPTTSRSAAGASGLVWPEQRVEPHPSIPSTEKSSESSGYVINIPTNCPRPAVTVSSTSSRSTTPAAEFAVPLPTSSPAQFKRASNKYPPPVPDQEEKAERVARNDSHDYGTASPTPPVEERPRTPSSMDEESSTVSPWELPQCRPVSPTDGPRELRPACHSAGRKRVRESSIPGMEDLNLGDKSSLASTTSEESLRVISPIPGGELDSEYSPSSPVSLPRDAGSEASSAHGFGPDSQPATPTSSRNTSDVFSPSEPTISHMSLLSSPGESNDASSQPPSEGNNTPTADRLRGRSQPRYLDRYINAILDQETRGGSNFLAKQGQVYQQVLRTFFDIKCTCMISPLLLLTSLFARIPPIAPLLCSY